MNRLESFRAYFERKAGGTPTLAAGFTGGSKSGRGDRQGYAGHGVKKKRKRHGGGRRGQGRGHQDQPQ